PLLDAEVARQGRPRLVIVVAPAELPVGPDRMWTRIASHGKRIPLQPPADGSDYLPLLLSGKPGAPKSIALTGLFATSKPEPYGAWSIDAGDTLAPLSRHESVVRLSYRALADYRARLMSD